MNQTVLLKTMPLLHVPYRNGLPVPKFSNS
jgi:hypothetical protein